MSYSPSHTFYYFQPLPFSFFDFSLSVVSSFLLNDSYFEKALFYNFSHFHFSLFNFSFSLVSFVLIDWLFREHNTHSLTNTHSSLSLLFNGSVFCDDRFVFILSSLFSFSNFNFGRLFFSIYWLYLAKTLFHNFTFDFPHFSFFYFPFSSVSYFYWSTFFAQALP